MLYTLRFKRGQQGVTLSFVDASTFEQAEKVGKRYCEVNMGCRFIRVEDAILADETILEDVNAAAAAAAPETKRKKAS